MPKYKRETTPAVVVADEDDQKAAVEGALARSGFTYGQLARQAKTGRFSTVRARMAWVAVGDLKASRAAGR
jgi:hypothetical protein